MISGSKLSCLFLETFTEKDSRGYCCTRILFVTPYTARPWFNDVISLNDCNQLHANEMHTDWQAVYCARSGRTVPLVSDYFHFRLKCTMKLKVCRIICCSVLSLLLWTVGASDTQIACESVCWCFRSCQARRIQGSKRASSISLKATKFFSTLIWRRKKNHIQAQTSNNIFQGIVPSILPPLKQQQQQQQQIERETRWYRRRFRVINQHQIF